MAFHSSFLSVAMATQTRFWEGPTRKVRLVRRCHRFESQSTSSTHWTSLSGPKQSSDCCPPVFHEASSPCVTRSHRSKGTPQSHVVITKNDDDDEDEGSFESILSNLRLQRDVPRSLFCHDDHLDVMRSHRPNKKKGTEPKTGCNHEE